LHPVPLQTASSATSVSSPASSATLALPTPSAPPDLLQEFALPGPLRLALDTEVSAHVLWSGAGATGRHHLASRIDFEGSPLWRAPVDLSDADDHQPPRIKRSGHALIHADLTGKSGPYAVDVSAEGRVLIQ
jgi:hypothetical protein